MCACDCAKMCVCVCVLVGLCMYGFPFSHMYFNLDVSCVFYTCLRIAVAPKVVLHESASLVHSWMVSLVIIMQYI